MIARNPPRFACPYGPTGVTFHDESDPTTISGELTVSWYHRNRLGAWSYVNSGWTSAPEPNTEHEILVYGELGTLIHTETEITGTSWIYLEADEWLDSGLERLNTHLRIKIRTWNVARTCGAIREIEWGVERV